MAAIGWAPHSQPRPSAVAAAYRSRWRNHHENAIHFTSAHVGSYRVGRRHCHKRSSVRAGGHAHREIRSGAGQAEYSLAMLAYHAHREMTRQPTPLERLKFERDTRKAESIMELIRRHRPDLVGDRGQK
jgi:hypothetical protein